MYFGISPTITVGFKAFNSLLKLKYSLNGKVHNLVFESATIRNCKAHQKCK